MADTKISGLADGSTAEATDKIPVARAGDNYYVTPSYIRGATDTPLAGTNATIATGTIVANEPVTFTQTWNNGAVTFSGATTTITDTASGVNSELHSWYLGATKRFGIGKNSTASSPTIRMGGDTQTGWYSRAGDFWSFSVGGTFLSDWSQNLITFNVATNVGWVSGVSPGSPDTAIKRNAAGVVEINDGNSASYADLRLRALRSNGVTFANLPAGAAGYMAYVTDSTTATWGATISGGGSNKVMAFHNGTNWTVMGA